MSDLGTLGGIESFANDINELGQVVGIYLSSGIRHTFLYQNRVMMELKPLGGNYSSAGRINDLGQVVGESKVSSPRGNIHAVLWNVPSQ